MSENNGWIKCSDELPAIFDHDGSERSNIVICFGREEDVDKRSTYFFAYMIKVNRFYGFNGECAHVTHWQPLPQPPEE